MAFWSSQTLEKQLDRLTDCPDSKMVDCNALTLRVGPEYYVTPGLETPSPATHTKKRLEIGDGMTIPPGQFAFLLTEEVITIPPEVMGFISIKATFKLRGLVNVSGFHVDPGWSGRLIFTVFNAGPSTIHLERNLPMFLLWIADLDDTSAKQKSGKGANGIPPGIIGNITGVVDSIYALEKRVETQIADFTEKQDAKITKVADKQEDFRKAVSDLKELQNKILLGFGIGALIIGAFVGCVVKVVADHVFPPTVPAAIGTPVQTTGASDDILPGGHSVNASKPATPPPVAGGGRTSKGGGNG